MSLEQKFTNACERVRKFSKRPSDEEMLEIYRLYKQATIGDVDICVKSGYVKAKAKWNAWNGMKGLNPTIAKERYITKVEEIAGKYEK